MKKMVIIGLVSAVAIGLGAMAFNADAFWGGKGFGKTQNTQEMIQLQEKIHEAIKNGDYNQWKDLIGDRPVGQSINESNFARYAEMMQLRWEGKFTEANQIRQELNLNNGGRKGCGGGCGMKQGGCNGSCQGNCAGAKNGSCGCAKSS